MGLDSVLRSTWSYGMVLLVLYLLVGGSLVWLTAISYGQLLFMLVALFISGLVVAGLRRSEADGSSDSVWNAIPNRQYDGRHAESGGLARGEQEQALQEIHDEAAQRHDKSHRNR